MYFSPGIILSCISIGFPFLHISTFLSLKHLHLIPSFLYSKTRRVSQSYQAKVQGVFSDSSSERGLLWAGFFVTQRLGANYFWLRNTHKWVVGTKIVRKKEKFKTCWFEGNKQCGPKNDWLLRPWDIYPELRGCYREGIMRMHSCKTSGSLTPFFSCVFQCNTQVPH